MIQNIRSSVFSVVGSHALLIFLVVFFPLLGTLQATQAFPMAVIPSGYLCTQQPGWASAPVGAPLSLELFDYAHYANGTFTVNGSGNQIYGTADAFGFAYRPLYGDGSIIARVVSVQGGSGYAAAGVMIRETLDTGSTNAKIAYWPSFGALYFDARTSTGGSTIEPGWANGAPPYWIKLVRSGSTFTSYASPDGANWTQVGPSETISMAQTVYVGLAVTSGSNATIATATFDNVSSTAYTSGPCISSVSATTGNIGSPVVINGFGFRTLQGSSEVFLNGTPVAINYWSQTSISVTIPEGAASGNLTVYVPQTTGLLNAYSNSVRFTVTSEPLPSGWLDADVGAVGVLGNATYTNGTFTVSGAGNQIYGTSDSFHFAYQQLSGDGSAVARVVSLQGAPYSAVAGLMIRETLDSGSTNAKMAVSYYIGFDVRTTANGTTSEPGGLGGTPPRWVKVVRSGNVFSGYASLDGINWTQAGPSQTINMAQNVYVGLVVDNGNTSALATATFDNVSVSSSSGVAPVIISLSATTGAIGSQVGITGSGFGAAQGSSEVTLNSTPVTVNFWSDTLINITIPTGATSGFFVVSVAPDMDDSNPVEFTVTSQPLPSGWLDADVGPVQQGNASYASGTFTVNGAGTQIYGTADAFHFAYQQLAGDGSIVARVLSVQTGAVAGVMIRETLDPGATNGKTAEWVPYGAYIAFDVRTATGGSTSEPGAVGGTTPPYWLKLVRSGNTFSSYASPDGVNWTQVGPSQTITMAQTVYAGLAVDSGTSTLATATFDNVSINSGSLSPNITALSQNYGSVGTSVGIVGVGFGSSQGSSTVTFNGAVGTPLSWSDNAIGVPVPAGATTGDVVVTVGNVASNGVQFTVVSANAPTIVSASSPSGPPGSIVVIVGTNFGSTQSGSLVSFNGSTAATLSWGNTTILAKVPASATTGPIQVTVDGTASNMVMFTVTPPVPTIVSLSETTGVVGDTLTITGSGFGSSGTVSFSGVAASASSWNDAAIVTQIPAGAQTGPVTVASGGQTSNGVTITIIGAPTLVSVNPLSGDAGTSLSLSGTNFGTPTNVPAVLFNGIAVGPTSWTSTSIAVTVPKGTTTGPLAVRVGNVVSNAITFTIVPTGSQVLSISPAKATLAIGQTLNLSLNDDLEHNITGATWSLSDNTLAQLSSGDPPVLTATNVGTETVTATWNGLSASAQITILAAGVSMPAGTVLWSLPTTTSAYSVLKIMQAVPSDGTTPDLIAVEDDGQGSIWLRGTSAAGEQLWHTRVGTSRASSSGLPCGGNGTCPDLVDQEMPDNLGGAIVSVTNNRNVVLGNGYGDVFFLDSLIRVDGHTGTPTWRYDSPGGFCQQDYENCLYASTIYTSSFNLPLFAIDQNGYILAVETVYDASSGISGSSTLIKIDPAAGVPVAKWQLPSSAYEVMAPPCESPFYPPPVTGNISVGPDGSYYLEVATYLAVGFVTGAYCQEGSVSATWGMSLLTVSPSGNASYSSLPNCETPVPIGVIPDGNGGALANYVCASHTSTGSLQWSAEVTDVGGSASSAAWNLPLTPSGELANYDGVLAEDMVLGDQGTYFITDHTQVMAFDEASGNQLWSWQPGSGNVEIIAATAGGGVAVRNVLTQVDPYGNVVPTGQEDVVRLDSSGNPTYDSWGTTGGSAAYGVLSNSTYIGGGLWIGTIGDPVISGVFGDALYTALNTWIWSGGDAFFQRSAGVPIADSKANDVVRGILTKAFWNNLKASHCAAVFNQGLVGAVYNYSFNDAITKAGITNFYDLGNPGVGNLTRRQVTAGEDPNDETLSEYIQNANALVTHNWGMSFKHTAVVFKAGLLSGPSQQFPLKPKYTVVHELFLHAYAAQPDSYIFTIPAFTSSGLLNTNPSDSHNISTWISTDCTCTPNVSAGQCIQNSAGW